MNARNPFRSGAAPLFTILLLTLASNGQGQPSSSATGTAAADREERIRAHRARIEAIIAANRNAALVTSGTASSPLGSAAAPEQIVPIGIVQQASRYAESQPEQTTTRSLQFAPANKPAPTGMTATPPPSPESPARR